MDGLPFRDNLSQALLAIQRSRSIKSAVTAFRLAWLVTRMARRAEGTFRFKFGDVRFIDAHSLASQYYEIFMGKSYDVIGVGDSPTIIDCGGNIGMSTIWFKQRYPNAGVFVIEADPFVAQVLNSNVQSLQLAGVEVRCAAVGGSTEAMSFQQDGSDSGRVVSAGGITIPGMRLSEHVRSTVDLLKLDIEGSEFDVIEDLCISGKISLVRNIVCEVHGTPESYRRVGELWGHLLSAGFHVSVPWASTGVLPGAYGATPFARAPSTAFLMHVIAWRTPAE